MCVCARAHSCVCMMFVCVSVRDVCVFVCAWCLCVCVSAWCLCVCVCAWCVCLCLSVCDVCVCVPRYNLSMHSSRKIGNRKTVFRQFPIREVAFILWYKSLFEALYFPSSQDGIGKTSNAPSFQFDSLYYIIYTFLKESYFICNRLQDLELNSSFNLFFFLQENHCKTYQKIVRRRKTEFWESFSILYD